MSCGILGICLWAALLIRGSDWPMAMVSPTVLALTPFTFFVPWWLWKNVLRAWNRIQSCKANTDSLQQERDEELSCKGSDSNTSVPSACEEREADAPLQFSLRSVFLLIVAMAILFGGLRTKIAQIQRQRLAVERLGGPSAVELWNADFFHRHSTPAWLKPILGEEYSADAHIHLQRDAIADEDLAYLQYFLNDVNLTLEGGFGGDSLRFVGRARNIRWMCLDDNPVTDNGLQHLKGLRSLESLSLASTEVTDAGLQYLSSLDGLWKLDLSGNQGVTDAGIVWLPGKRLGDLNFDDTGITDAALGRLRRLPSHLACANTEITDLGLKYLEDAPMLMTLNLNGTRVTDEGLAYLRGCQRLIRLHLNGTRVTDAGLVHLAHLNRLNGLSLGNTRITDDGLAHLADLKRLGELDLSNTDITDDGLKYLEYLQGLDELDLRGTKVTQQGIQQFKSPSWCTVQGP